MPKGVYTRTEEHSRALSQAWQRPEVRERHKLSPDAKEKWRQSIKQVRSSFESRKLSGDISRAQWECPKIRESRITGIQKAMTPERRKQLAELARKRATPEFLKKMSETHKKRWTLEMRQDYSKKLTEAFKNPVTHAIKTAANRRRWDDPEYVAKASQRLSKQEGKYLQGSFKSVKNKCNITFQSSYELHAFIRLEHDDSVKSYGRCGFSIIYINSGLAKRYIPDIFVEYTDGRKCIIEVKPLLKVNEATNLTKARAGEEYCRENGLQYIIWTEKDTIKFEMEDTHEHC